MLAVLGGFGRFGHPFISPVYFPYRSPDLGDLDTHGGFGEIWTPTQISQFWTPVYSRLFLPFISPIDSQTWEIWTPIVADLDTHKSIDLRSISVQAKSG